MAEIVAKLATQIDNKIMKGLSMPNLTKEVKQVVRLENGMETIVYMN